MRLLPLLPFQIHPAYRGKLMRTLLFASVCLLLAACGKMPPNVDAPPDVDSSAYYQTYPDFSEKLQTVKPEPSHD